MAFRAKKSVKKSQYYVWFMGTKEARGLRGEEFIRPIVEQFLTDNNDDISKVTLQISEKGVKIVQVVPKKSNRSKAESIKYFIPDHCITCVYHSPPPHDDVVSCILLIYNPETECPVHVHSYRCDSVETATLLGGHLQQLIAKPDNQQKFEILEAKLVSQGLLPSQQQQQPQRQQRRAPPVDGHSTGSSPGSSEEYEQRGGVPRGGGGGGEGGMAHYPTRDHVYMPNDKMSTLMDALSIELRQKLKSREMQPILLPPKDYDTWRRCHGDVREAENRKSLQLNIVGPNAVHVPTQQETVDGSRRSAVHERQSSGVGSGSAVESPPTQQPRDAAWDATKIGVYHFGMTEGAGGGDERDSGHHSDDENRVFVGDDGFMYTKPSDAHRKLPNGNHNDAGAGIRVRAHDNSDGIRVRPYRGRQGAPSPTKSIDSGVPRNDDSLQMRDSPDKREQLRERKWKEMVEKLDDTGIFRTKDVNQPAEVNKRQAEDAYFMQSARSSNPSKAADAVREPREPARRSSPPDVDTKRQMSPLRRAQSHTSPTRKQWEPRGQSPQRFGLESSSRTLPHDSRRKTEVRSSYEPEVASRSMYEPEVASRSMYEPDKNSHSMYEPNVTSRSAYEKEVTGRAVYEPDIARRSAYEPDIARRSTYEPDIARRSPHEAAPAKKSLFQQSESRYERQEQHATPSPRRPPYETEPARGAPHDPPRWTPYDADPSARMPSYEPRPDRPPQHKQVQESSSGQRSPYNPVQPRNARHSFHEEAHQRSPPHERSSKHRLPYSAGDAEPRSRPREDSHDAPPGVRLRRQESDVARLSRGHEGSPNLQRHRREQWAQSTPAFATVSPPRDDPRGYGRERMPPLAEDSAAMPPVGYTNAEFDHGALQRRSQRDNEDRAGHRAYPERYGSLDHRTPSPAMHQHERSYSGERSSHRTTPQHQDRSYSGDRPSPRTTPQHQDRSYSGDRPSPHATPQHHRPSPQPTGYLSRDAPPPTHDVPKNYQGMHERPLLSRAAYPDGPRARADVRRSHSFHVGQQRQPIAVYSHR